jgi:hypothetical protein
MAKKVTKKPAGKRRSRSSEKSAAPKRAVSVSSARDRQKRASGNRPEPAKSAADALVGLLESPLVADILAAGAAAALAALAQRGLSRKKGSKNALKAAATAAAAAIGERLVDEFHEIMAAGKETKRRES